MKGGIKECPGKMIAGVLRKSIAVMTGGNLKKRIIVMMIGVLRKSIVMMIGGNLKKRIIVMMIGVLNEISVVVNVSLFVFIVKEKIGNIFDIDLKERTCLL
ncbi:hypothetical protein [Bacillus wiedmannii]|uniref:hypothetical protein n=1 Tax=Bacillus wiedmannii TaxID=1890302 RepID=UPI0027B9B32A|nr:hypothetical protein [Bacillus wiedmannii]